MKTKPREHGKSASAGRSMRSAGKAKGHGKEKLSRKVRGVLAVSESAGKVATVGGKVTLSEADYEALLRKADVWEPDLPGRDARGNYPALAALAVVQARDILRARRQLGLSQADLARRAGIRPETLNRIEQGRNKPSIPTIAKIDRALKAAAG